MASLPQPKLRVLIVTALIVLADLCLAVEIWALFFSGDLAREDRAHLIIITSVGLLACFTGLYSIHLYMQWQRRRTSQKVLSTWQENLDSGAPAKIDSARHLSEGALRILAMQLFTRIGYRILNRDEDEGYVRMMNPQGQLELVACRQQSAPLDIQPVYEFVMDLKHAGAVKGHYWAAGGFTAGAAEVASQRSILLADRDGIGIFIDSVHAHDPKLFE